MTDQTQLNLPGYTLLGLAGKGGMGNVYKAEQASPRRLVALKVLSGAAADPERLAAFRREANVIAHLEHPYIVPLYDFGEQDGVPYLVLRYLTGGTVADRLRAGPLDLPTAARWIQSVADALDFAHGRGLVHKDIKPSNVLLDAAGNAYLSDFGIAGALADIGRGAPAGSAAYMSPEQGRSQAVDGRADIYALAVMLFEMLTGQKPYTAETALGMIVRHINDPIPSTRELNPSIPLAVDELIRWAMAKDPAERPQTAAQFAGLLKQAMAHPDTPLRAAGPAGPASGESATVAVAPRPRSNLALWLGGFALAAVCLLTIALLSSGMLAAFVLSSTPTAIPTATKLPTETPGPTSMPTPEGQLLADDFSDPNSGFAVAQDADGGVEYADGALRLSVLKKGIEWFSPSGRVKAQDVAIEVDAQEVSGPRLTEMAVICRWRDSDNYTALALSGDGTSSIWQKRDKIVTRLVDWTPAASLAAGPGIAHHLRVTCAGSQLRLEADGTLLVEATDPSPISGDVTLMAGLREPGELTVTFDNVMVKKP